MIKALLLFSVPAVFATGGHHGGGVGATQYISAGYARPYTSGYTSLSYVTARPQLYSTTYPQFAEVGVAAGPVLPALPQLPAHGGHGGHGHGKHGGGAVTAEFIVQQPQSFIVQQPQRFIVAAPQRTVSLAYEPLAPLYDSETVQERVFREPISKTVTEMPDDVRRVKKVVNQHFPMIHQQVTDHYTIEDTVENNVIHHYYEPEERYLGMMEGEKYSTSVQHLDHPGEMYQTEDVIEEMVVETPSYKTIMTEEPYQRMETYQVPGMKTVVTEVPRIQEFVTEVPFQRKIPAPVATPALRAVSSRKAIQRTDRMYTNPTNSASRMYTNPTDRMMYTNPSVPSYSTGDVFPQAVRQAVRSGY